jgi:bacterioferritin-associated ferredoxin
VPSVLTGHVFLRWAPFPTNSGTKVLALHRGSTLQSHGVSDVAMLVCQCNMITQKEVEETIVSMLDEDPWQLIVPAKVYHTMSKRGRCCGCFPNVVETIIRVTEAYHARLDAAQNAATVTYLDQVRALRERFGRKFNERRQKGHRAA